MLLLEPGTPKSNKDKIKSLVSINNLPISPHSISSISMPIPRDYVPVTYMENGIEKRDSLKLFPITNVPNVPTFPSFTIKEKESFFEQFIQSYK